MMIRRHLVEKNLEYSRACLEILGMWIGVHPRLSWIEPRAGFTGFPRYDYDIGSVEFCEGLLREEGVLVSPGAFFGVENHIRICTGVPVDILREGLRRVDAFMGRLG